MLPAKLATNSRKLFITRKDATRRRASNEAELEHYLLSKGFETVMTGKLSISEQAQLFAEAECVVATHGAALANLLFCWSHTRVLEIAAPKFDWELFAKLASQCGLDYRKVKANDFEQNTVT